MLGKAILNGKETISIDTIEQQILFIRNINLKNLLEVVITC